jgi:hypothetical protein
LELHGVAISKEAKSVINISHKKGDKIAYLEALVIIAIDQDTNSLNNNNNTSNWVVRKKNDSNIDTYSVRSVMSRAMSDLQVRSRIRYKHRQGGQDLNLTLNPNVYDLEESYGVDHSLNKT